MKKYYLLSIITLSLLTLKYPFKNSGIKNIRMVILWFIIYYLLNDGMVDAQFFKKEVNYCQYGRHHPLCKYDRSSTPKCGKNLNEPLTENEKDHILKLHNKFRSQVATGKEGKYFCPEAANMHKLEWDDELELLSEAIVKRCRKMEPSSPLNENRRLSRFRYVGQNIHVMVLPLSRNVSAAEIKKKYCNETNSINEWYATKSYMSSNGIHGYWRYQAEPFVQIVWGRNRYIGCQRYVMKLKNHTIIKKLICHYGPGSADFSKDIYKIGTPCSDCGLGVNCSADYAGLCKGSSFEMANQYMIICLVLFISLIINKVYLSNEKYTPVVDS